MGSTVLAYPAVMELKRRLAQPQIFFLVLEENRAILEILGAGLENNIIAIRSGSVWSLIVDGLCAMKKIYDARIDASIDMDFFSRFSAAFAFVTCRGRRVGFHAFTNEGLCRGDLLTHRVLYNPHIHTSLAFLSLVKTLLAECPDHPQYKAPVMIDADEVPRYRPSPELIKNVQDKLVSSGFPRQIGQRPLVIVNPNSSAIFPLRKWPLHHFVEFCTMLLAENSEARIVVTGSASEVADADFIAGRVKSPRCVSLAGKTSFAELMALYSLSALMVTNDSGPAHFASLLRLPTLVFFGPETPRLYQPLGSACKSIYADFACSPCVSVYNNKKSTCLDNKCLQAIAPDVALREALSLLSCAIGR